MLEPAFSLPSLAEAERKQLLSQRKKAYSLIFLMIMLAQTSYIGALEGWSLYTELEEVQQEPLTLILQPFVLQHLVAVERRFTLM